MQSTEQQNSDYLNDPITLKVIDADYDNNIKNGILSQKKELPSFAKESVNLKQMQLISLLSPEQCRVLNERVKMRGQPLKSIPITIHEEDENSKLLQSEKENILLEDSLVQNKDTIHDLPIDTNIQNNSINEIDKENISLLKSELDQTSSPKAASNNIISNVKQHTIDTNLPRIKKEVLMPDINKKENLKVNLEEPLNIQSKLNTAEVNKNNKYNKLSLNFVKALKNYKAKVINVINDKNCEINKRVKQIFIINLVEDVRKRNYIITVMKKYGINYSLVIVDKVSTEQHKYFCDHTGLTRVELGCSMSHLWCLLKGIQNNLENMIIFEDDIIFHKDFINYFCHIYDSKPKHDFLLLGAHDFMFSKSNYKNLNENIYKPNPNSQHIYGAHANYYSLKGMKRMFNIRISQISYFDKEYMLMFNHFENSGVVYPNMVVANVSLSGLNHTRSFFTDSESGYYQKCFINFNFNNYNFLYINLLDNIDSLNDNDDYETLTEKYLYNAFHDFDKIELIKKRLSMEFFTIEDIKNIITNH